MRYLLRWLLFLGLVVTQPACSGPPSHYSAEAIEARVIDADSKTPLEGVIVTANWQLLGGMEGSLPLSQLMVMEAITDRNGAFKFPAWGPLKRSQGYLREDDPQLLLFRSGYEYRKLSNPVSSKINHDPLRRSDWNGKTIEMRKFKETDDQVHYLVKYEGELGFLLETDEWRKTPCTLLSLHTEAKKLGIKSFVDRFQVPNIKRSEEVARFLEAGTQCEKY